MKKLTQILLILLPNLVFASDPTGLIVLFIEVPTMLVAIILIILSLAIPKNGVILMSVCTGLQLPMLFWAMDVNYNGWIQITTFLVSIIVLIVAIIRKKKHESSEIH